MPIYMEVEQLRQNLLSNGIPCDQWGQGKAKSIGSLLEELEMGESSLVIGENGQLLRHLEVVVAYVFHVLEDNKLLRVRETRQEFLNPVRFRKREHVYPSVAEKMVRNEDPQQAIDRALHGEELQLQGQLQKNYIGASVQVQDSQSFPGLTTEYKFYKFFVLLQEPEKQYRPEGYVEEQLDKVHDAKRIYFEWCEA